MTPFDPMVAQALAGADQQRQQQQAMVGALQATMRQPHTIEVVQTSITELDEGPNGTHVLKVATPDGRRRDIMLSGQAVAAIVAAHERKATERPVSLVRP
jgi:hypothetical protein